MTHRVEHPKHPKHITRYACPRCGYKRAAANKHILCRSCWCTEKEASDRMVYCDCSTPMIKNIPLFQTVYCGSCSRPFRNEAEMKGALL